MKRKFVLFIKASLLITNKSKCCCEEPLIAWVERFS